MNPALHDWLTNELGDKIAENKGLRSEVERLQSANDALTRELANKSDSRTATLAAERLAIMERIASHAARWSFGHDSERDDFGQLFAHVAEHGKRADIEEARVQYEQWEGRHG